MELTVAKERMLLYNNSVICLRWGFVKETVFCLEKYELECLPPAS